MKPFVRLISLAPVVLFCVYATSSTERDVNATIRPLPGGPVRNPSLYAPGGSHGTALVTEVGAFSVDIETVAVAVKVVIAFGDEVRVVVAQFAVESLSEMFYWCQDFTPQEYGARLARKRHSCLLKSSVISRGK
jgi:hypothetical protein